MSMNLPPQAYTRETLMQAFDWIRTQPKQIQELASTSDALVSIYMQARRRGGQFTATNPVSSQSFKQDLKNLAEGLKEFDGAEPMAQPPVHHVPTQQMPVQQMQSVQRQTQMAPQAPTYQTPPPPPPYTSTPTYQTSQYAQPTPPPTAQQTYYAAATPAFESESALDAKSLDAAKRVQQRFNLSSENEAIRLLIALGYEKIREMAGKF